MKTFFYKTVVVVTVLLAGAVVARGQESGRTRFQGNLKVNGYGAYWHPHTMVDASFGCRFNEKRFLGLGSGYHLFSRYYDANPDESNGLVPAVPVFADYIRYFPFAKHPRHALYLGLEAGGAYCVGQLPLKHETKRYLPYANGKAGFDFGLGKCFGLTVGLNFVCDYYTDFGLGLGVNFGFRF